MTSGSAQEPVIILDGINLVGTMPDAWHGAIYMLPREHFPAHVLATEEGARFESAFSS